MLLRVSLIEARWDSPDASDDNQLPQNPGNLKVGGLPLGLYISRDPLPLFPSTPLRVLLLFSPPPLFLDPPPVQFLPPCAAVAADP